MRKDLPSTAEIGVSQERATVFVNYNLTRTTMTFNHNQSAYLSGSNHDAEHTVAVYLFARYCYADVR